MDKIAIAFLYPSFFYSSPPLFTATLPLFNRWLANALGAVYWLYLL